MNVFMCQDYDLQCDKQLHIWKDGSARQKQKKKKEGVYIH